ncbi:DHA2 family efflux MFS transporter permease subunit [Kitasatospora sp. NPDC101183]|uniref:DHA2 family efflux MFS transporter permease subunit n=1 Tax=Kitasatospora sp. NPDC101183 TaxID=3364100 RepID=UPI00380B7C6C
MGESSARRKGLALLTLCIAMFMAMLDNVIVNVALPRIGQDLDAGISGLQWVAEGYSLIYAALVLTGGALGDRYGRARMFVLGLALFTAGSAVAALAGSIGVLVAARMLQGIGAAVLTPGSLSLLGHVFTDQAERAKAIGLWSGVSALGLAVGPVIGGPMVEHLGWSSVFWINVPIGLAGVVLAAKVLPEIPPRARRIDYGGFALSAAGLGLLVYALIEGPSRGWSSAVVLGCGIAGAALLIAFLVLELRLAEPMLELELFRDGALSGALLGAFMVSFGMFGAMFFLPLMMQGVLGWSPSGAGYGGLPMTAMLVVAGPLSGRLATKYGPRLPMVVGIALCALGLGGLSLYGDDAHYVGYVWTLFTMGFGMGLTFTPISVAVLQRVAPVQMGMASATIGTLRELGGVFGIAALGAVMTSRMTDELTSSLHRLGVPSESVGSLTDAPTGGAHQAGAAAAALPGPLQEAVDGAFTEGLHLAMRTGSAALVVTAVLVAVLLGRAARPQSPADGGGTADGGNAEAGGGADRARPQEAAEAAPA